MSGKRAPAFTLLRPASAREKKRLQFLQDFADQGGEAGAWTELRFYAQEERRQLENCGVIARSPEEQTALRQALEVVHAAFMNRPSAQFKTTIADIERLQIEQGFRRPPSSFEAGRAHLEAVCP